MKSIKSLVALSFLFANPAFAFAQTAPTIPEEAPIIVETTIKSKAAVISGELKEIGLWGIGIDQSDFKPVESDLWLNSRGENLGILFDKINANNKFVPVNQLVQRILFSGGRAPIASNEIAKKRLLAAARIGDAEKAAQLLSIVPQINQSQYLSAAYAESLFALGKNDEACALLNDSQPETPVRIILELRAVCYALNGENAASMVMLDLATSGQTKSAGDQWLARAIIGLGQTSAITNLKYRSDNGYYLALSNQLKLDINSIMPQSTAPINLLTLAKTASIAQNQLQKNAAKLGILAIDEYRNMQIDEINAMTTALDVKVSELGDIEIATFDGDDFVKELLSASDFDDWWVIAQRLGPKLKTISNPNPKTIDTLIDASLANADLETARRFIGIGGSQALYRNIILAIIDSSKSEPIIRSALMGPFAANYPKPKAVADLSIFWALGISDIGREALLETPSNGGTQLPQNIILSLEDALARGAKAEIVLNSALALQAIDPKSVDLAQIARIVRALKLSGFENEAKDLAIFAILARRTSFGNNTPNIRASSANNRLENAPAGAPANRQNRPATQEQITPAPTRARNAPAATQPSKPTPARQSTNIPEWRPKVD